MMIRFSEEQKSYIDSRIDQHVYLKACPGSGKTEVVAAKVAQEMAKWDKYPRGMAILSFSNSATDELRERISKYSSIRSNPFPHFVGTFDSFILKNIVSPIAHEITGYKGKDGDYSIKLVENSSPLHIYAESSLSKRGKLRANQFDYSMAKRKFIFNTDDMIYNSSLNKGTYNQTDYKNFIQAKKELLLAGFATYKDIELLAVKILIRPQFKHFAEIIAKKFPLLIIDECQDLSYEQLKILGGFVSLGAKIHLVGDINQSIYGFRHSDPNQINDFIDKTIDIKLELAINRRSAQPIVDVCRFLVTPNSYNYQRSELDSCCHILEYNECPTEVVPTFMDLIKSYRDSVIVARGHSTLTKFTNGCNTEKNLQKVALSIALFDKNDMFKLDSSLRLFSEYLRSHLERQESVKPNSFNCPQSISSSVYWRKFLFNSLSHLASKGLGDTTKTWQQWCKTLKTELRTLNSQPFVDEVLADILVKLQSVNLSSPNGKTNEEVGKSLQLKSERSDQLRLTTIHQVKGETHDATMLVSTKQRNPQAPESHWQDWLEDSSSEAARLAYVASSRPRFILAWAVKGLENEDRQRLARMGFTFTPLIEQRCEK